MKIFMPALGRVNTQNRDGSEVRTVELIRLWQAEGHQLSFFLPQRQARTFESQGLKGLDYDFCLDSTESESEHLGNVLRIYGGRILRGLRHQFAKDIDVVYIPSDFLVDLLPGLRAAKQNPQARLVICLFLVAPVPWRGYEGHYSGKLKRPSLRGLIYYFTQRWAIRLIKRSGGVCLVLNDQDRGEIIKAGVSPGAVFTVPMGVDVQRFAAIEPTPDTPGFEGIFVGRLHPQKGLPDLIEIWSRVVERNPEARLAIIGGGSEEVKHWLDFELKDRKLAKNVFPLGFVQGDEKVRLIKAAKVFLMPSHYESWGMTAVEAMACGKPVVAYDLPVFKEVFPEAMIKVPYEDFDAFANKVQELLQDANRYQAVVTQSLDFAPRYDWPKVAEYELKLMTGTDQGDR
ncbi:MAG: glycosyltransferase family 4 protein [bacterium]|nr:glycosyltransferase family 4 protein [bacterium]